MAEIKKCPLRGTDCIELECQLFKNNECGIVYYPKYLGSQMSNICFRLDTALDSLKNIERSLAISTLEEILESLEGEKNT